MPLPLDPDKPILLTAQLKLPSMPAKSPGFYHLGTKRSIIASCTAAQSRHGHCILLILADNSGSAQSPAFDALFFAPTVKVLVSDSSLGRSHLACLQGDALCAADEFQYTSQDIIHEH